MVDSSSKSDKFKETNETENGPIKKMSLAYKMLLHSQGRGESVSLSTHYLLLITHGTVFIIAGVFRA